MKKWSREYNECVLCGTTEIKHNAKGICCNCYNKKWRKENPEKVKKSTTNWNKKNSKKCKETLKKWREKNPDKAREAIRNWNRKNPEKYKEAVRKWQKGKLKDRLRNDPCFKLRRNISTSICIRLKSYLSSKKGKSTFSFLPYTMKELKQHLEKQFEPWMNWNNWGNGRGKWNIDHIKPHCKFDYKNVEDEEFQKCWALKNLRPLDAIENIRKGGKYVICNMKYVNVNVNIY